MRLIEFLAMVFINTFGITQPDDRTRRRAAWFILSMLTVLLLALCVAGIALFRLIRG